MRCLCAFGSGPSLARAFLDSERDQRIADPCSLLSASSVNSDVFCTLQVLSKHHAVMQGANDDSADVFIDGG